MTSVLIVDDNDTNLYLLRTLLQGHGFEVVEARHGAEALTRARQQPPSLIVSDLLMPVLDGYALLRQCKTDDRLQDIPFIVYTATYTEPKDERLALALGADAFVIKPSEPDVLLALIRDVLDRHARGELSPAAPPSVEEVLLINSHNEVLIRKLEKKAFQLEEVNRTLLAEVAERRQTEHALIDSEERYRSLFYAIADPLFVYDRETLRYLAVNDAAVEKYGYSRAEFLGMTIEDIRPPEDVTALREMLAGAGMKLEHRGAWRHRTKDGAVIDVEISAHGLQYAGRPACVIQARDVTEQRHAAAEIAQGHTLRRIAGQIARIGGWSLDLAARRVTWSDEICAIHEEPIGHQPMLEDGLSYYLPEYRQPVTNMVRACATDGTPFDFEAELLTARGRRIWVRSIGEAVRDPQGRIVGVQGAFQDITDRKRIEDEQRALADRLTATFESITDGFHTLDRDWRITYINAEGERMVGRTRDVLVGTSIWEAFPETRGTVFETEYRRAVDEHVTVDFTEYFPPLGRWFAIRAYPSEHGLAVYFRDVTAAHEAEQALRLSEERFRLLSKATSDVVWEWDLASNALTWNEGITALLGYEREEIGTTIESVQQLIHPDDLPAVNAAIEAALTSGAESWSAEYRVGRRDGGYTPVLDSGYIIRDAEGRPVRLLSGMKDLTERRRAEESLLLRNRAIQAASQGILVTDPHQPDNPIVFANLGFERLTGYAPDEMLGRNCRFLQGPDSDPDTIGEIRAAVAAARSCSVEILNYRKDGTTFWNELSISPVLDTAGQLTHFVGVQTDVTERRRLEDQYRQAQKMEAVGRLAGGVAHDFNNLLTVISGYSEMLLARPHMDAATRDSVVAIRTAGEQAASLTRQLLGFSRKSLVQPTVLDLNAVVTQTTSLLRRLIGEDIELTTRLDPALAPVKMDPGQLDQVLMNLAVNARDAMPSGGTLTVETSNVAAGSPHGEARVDCAAGPHVLLAVTDSGCGMTPEVMARIFEPFFTTKAVGRGTGLGLATVFGIVEQGGGCIHVSSEPDHGTTFRLYLPAVAEPSAVEPGADVPTGVTGTETILLVEDEDALRTLTSLSLRMHGYQVLTAIDGGDALRVMASHDGPLHLVLTDVVMPKVSGPALAQQLKAAAPGLKVLFMSGYTDDAVLRHGLIEAEMAFIQKPFTPLSLATKVRQVLDGPAGL
jgi:PAS domain S-box-containing protein